MDYIDSVKKAIDYIENRLQEEMTTEEVARFAGFSPYHFHRIFQSITRNSINEYVRRRRLTHSAYELFYSNIRIVELAGCAEPHGAYPGRSERALGSPEPAGLCGY